MILGLTAAFSAATCYGLASVVQSIAANRSAASGRIDVRVIARLVAQWRYLVGLGLDLTGFVAAVVALRTLPLFVVQAAVASSVGVTAVAARRLLKTRLSHAEARALLALGGGLLLLAATARPEHAMRLSEPGPTLLLAAAPALALIAWAFGSSTRKSAAALLAAGAGVSFGAVGIAARAFVVPHPWLHALRDPLLYAIVVDGALATVLFAAALQRGRVTTVAAVTFSVETVAPAFVGIAWLGDRTRAGLAPVAAGGFALALGGAIALARFAQPAPTSEIANR
ncbi:MAG TPA: hypothetical protein VHC63_11425 [Acidimicrobiales bacterium]|nr:hypothetical protein [Acidimicrobiales bacterium]